MKVVEEKQCIRVMEDGWEPLDVIRETVDAGQQEDAFYVMDLGEVARRYYHWKEMMPRVEPHYAVKCNDDRALCATLAALGAGFDCASRGEMDLITGLGVAPERIIFANPAKMSSHIRHADAVGVHVMTFDSETELIKVKKIMPHAELVLRIRADATVAQCPLGIKFGCDPVAEAPRLLKLASVLKSNVIGISFHVGSGAMEPAAYSRAIQMCRALFDLGEQLGLPRMRLLDIGGGYPGGANTSIAEVAEAVNQAIDAHFPDPSVKIISEPGRYFAAAAYTLATAVYASRELMPKVGEEDEHHTMLFINDGVYGSFNCVLYDHQQVTPTLLEEPVSKVVKSSIWGPTCDGLDCVVAHLELPPLRPGDWLAWRDMGAYTLPVASPFNGFPVPTVQYCVAETVWEKLKGSLPFQQLSVPPPAPPRALGFVECALK